MTFVAPNPLELFADRCDPPESEWIDAPGDWARERLGAHITVAQDEICDAVALHRHVAVPSAHDLGKSFTGSNIAGWWIDVHPPGEALVVSTAPTWPQVQGVLWQEIADRHRDGKLRGRLTADCQWKLGMGDGPDKLIGLGRKPADYDPTAFQGYHRRYLLVIIDEACGVPRMIWDAAESIATNEHSRILALGNPDDPSSYFADVCKPGSGWHVIHLDALRSPNMTRDAIAKHEDLQRYMIGQGIPPTEEEIPERLRDLLVSPTWVAERMRRWGVTSPMFISKVRGRFPNVTVDTLIHPHWVTLAQAREARIDHTDSRMGVDVARYGTDHSIIMLRLGWHCRVIEDIPYGPVTELAGKVQLHGGDRINTPIANVDDVGVGGGVTDILIEDGYPTLPMVAGAACSLHEKLPNGKPRFVNARSEWWWDARLALAGLSGTGEDSYVDLDPMDDELAAQLTAVKYRVNRHGQIEVETKDQLKARGLSSPDRGDAFVMSLVRTAAAAVPLPQFMVTGDLLTRPM